VAFESLANNLVPGDTNKSVDVFLRDRGAAAGVGGLDVQGGSNEVAVSGWATFSGAGVTASSDPPDDGIDAVGAEIVGASMIHRPEHDDLLLRTRLASLPAPSIGSLPGVMYRWRFTAAGTSYEVRALSIAPTAGGAAPYFRLFRCSPECAEIADLEGGLGTTGAEVRVSVPLTAIGADPSATLSSIEADVTMGDAVGVAPESLDELVLPGADLSTPAVDLAIAPASAPEDEVAYTVSADLSGGFFSATLDTMYLAPGEYRVWVRGCLGTDCGTRSVALTL
jgi:hypothetical protein